MPSKHPFNQEPSYTPPSSPAQTRYTCDVLVVGGGFAGVMAARQAAKAGKHVILVDKGRPGYSGSTPYGCGSRWFDPERDDRNAWKQAFMRSSQYMSNQNWVDAWLEDSRAVYEAYCEFGLFDQYPRPAQTGHLTRNDYTGYRNFIGKQERHTKFMRALEDAGVTVVTQTMICDVLQIDGCVCGAVGFHVPSGAGMVFHARASVLCMGNGAYRSGGWPVCGLSFDGIAIGYRLGLPIIGQEYEDFHFADPDRPALAFGWNYLESMNQEDDATQADYLDSCIRRRHHALDQVATCADGGPLWERVSRPAPGSPPPGSPRGVIYGAAPGFCLHLTSGIYCGPDETHGFTGIPGLYCAGDGCNGGPIGGSTYAGKIGLTSNFCGVQGKRAGEAAALACAQRPLVVDDEAADAALQAIFAPMYREHGYDPTWALDCLNGIMAPFWTIVLKNEPCLNAALTQVTYMRDQVIPHLVAADSHGLRTCIEVEHKVLEAEMKLRTSLAHQESRGGHYRADYPFRRDDEYLCYLGAVQREDGQMEIRRYDYPDEWKGDRSEAYTQRYGGAFFVGEAEALGLKTETEVLV